MLSNLQNSCSTTIKFRSRVNTCLTCGRFFKSHVLRSLEAQQLIHLAVVRVSISTKQGLLDAEKAAARKFRRMCLEADRAKLPRPTAPPPPATTVKDFVWTLGPAPTEEDMREGRVNYAPMDEPMTLEEAAAKCDDAAWSYAERLEAHYHKARLVEEANIVERKAIRAAYYKEMRVEAKRQRDEDIAAGRGPLLRQEARRAAAIEAVSQYAQATGEDVSDWYEEIAKANFGDELPQSIPSTRPSQSKRVDGRVRLTPVPAVKAVKKYAGAKQF